MIKNWAGESPDHCIFTEQGYKTTLEGPYYKSAINPLLIAYKGKSVTVKVFRLVPVELLDVPDVVTTYHKEIRE